MRRRSPRTLRLPPVLLVDDRLTVAVVFSAAVERQENAEHAGEEAKRPDVVVSDDTPPARGIK